MRSVKLIITGSEVTNGYIQDTNTGFFARQIYSLGLSLSEVRIIPDDFNKALETVKDLSNGKDLIIMTGGLGPTDDDLTVDILSKFTGRKPVSDEFARKNIESLMEAGTLNVHNSSMKNRLIRQSRIIEGSIALKNPVGLAPGIYIPELPLIALPGFPLEINGIWPQVKKIISTMAPPSQLTKTMALWGIAESRLFESINFPPEVHAGVHSLPYGTKLFLRCEKKKEPLLEETLLKVKNLFEFNIVENPVNNYIEYLKANKLTLGTVESCTGGLGGKIITDIPEVSSVYNGSIVTYHDNAKISCAGVQPETIQKYGAVSLETAAEMAKGGLEKLNVDKCLSLTGIAGPGGGSKEKPVGTVYIAIADKKKNRAYVKCFKFPYGRERFRMAAIYAGFLSMYQKDVVFQENDDKWLKEKTRGNFTIIDL
ncbi:MAG: nicotinamide-nucleotide amidohydrolase family protein [Leptospirales bacterium]